MGWDGGDEPFLGKLPPGPHRLPRDLVRDNQRRRLLHAALDVFAERGVAAATVKELVRRAGVSRATFYECFADGDDCMAALHEEVLAWLSEQVGKAVAEQDDWAAKVRTGVARTVELLADDPRLVTVCADEAPAVRVPRIRARHELLVEQICAGLRAGRTGSRHGEELPEILEPALVSGAIYVISRSLADGAEADVAGLAAELADVLLLPYAS